MNKELQKFASSEPLTVERTISAPVAQVWTALTTAEALKQWSFEIDDFKPEAGFEFRFSVEKEGFTYPHVCVVTEVVPHKRLAYTWRYEGYEGETLVSFELEPEGQKTRVKVTHLGLGTLPQTPNFERKNFQRGWTNLLSSLSEYTETGK